MNILGFVRSIKRIFGRKRSLVNELVKSISNMYVPGKANGKSLRLLDDTLRVESLGLNPDVQILLVRRQKPRQSPDSVWICVCKQTNIIFCQLPV